MQPKQPEQMMADASWPGGAATGPRLLACNSSSMNRKRTCEDNVTSCAPGAWPQPKWPPNHSSEAFEAVAVKKVCFWQWA